MYNHMLEKHFLVSSLSHDFTAEGESPAVLDGEQRLFSTVVFPVSMCGWCFLNSCVLQSSEIQMSVSLNSPCGARPAVNNWE